MAGEFAKYGAVAEFQHNSSYLDYPINSVKRPELAVRVKNDAELLKLLWPRK